MVYVWAIMIFVVSLALIMLNTMFFMKSKEKWSNSPFECGMDQMQNYRPPMYMHFIFISIVFLVFDVELVISIPIILSLLEESIWNLFWVIFFMIMTMGLFLEIYLGSVDWKT